MQTHSCKQSIFCVLGDVYVSLILRCINRGSKIMKRSFFYTIALFFMGLIFESHASGLKKIASLGEASIKKVATTVLEEIGNTTEVERPLKKTRIETCYSKRFFTESIPISIDVRRLKEPGFVVPKGMKVLPISNDPDFPLYARYIRDKEFLPKLYTALKYLTGPSDENFDNYKGSFSFQFMLDVEKKMNRSQYLFWMMQFRSFMRIKLYQIVPDSDPRREEVFTKATESLFSEDDIIAFTFAFVDDLLKRLEREKHIPEPFVLSSHSDCLIYGYLDNEYFATEFTDRDSYAGELKALEARLTKDNPTVDTEVPKESKS